MRALEFVEVPEFTRDLHRVGDDQTLYLHLPRAEKVILLFVYTKARQSDLTPDQRSRLRRLAAQIEQAYATHKANRG